MLIVTYRSLTEDEITHLTQKYGNEWNIFSVSKNLTDYREIKKVYYNLLDKKDDIIFIENVDIKLIMLCMRSIKINVLCNVNGYTKIF